MPDPIPVTDADSFVEESKRLFKESINGLSAEDKNKVGTAIRRANQYAQLLLGVDASHPDYIRLKASLSAERSTIQNIIYTDKRNDTNKLVEGLRNAGTDLIISLAIGAL